MWAVAHHLLLGLAVASLGGAALRAASLAAPDGLERIIAAAALGAGAAALQALALGLAGAGTHPAALAAASAGTWLAARHWLPAPACPPGLELARWWRSRSRAEQAIAGLFTGLALAQLAFMLRYPQLDADANGYHLPEVTSWIGSGRPGTLNPLLAQIPVENYPVTNEVLLTWLLGLSRGFAAVVVFSTAMGILLAAAAWTGLRAVGVPRAAAGLGAAALLTSPHVFQQLNGPYTDLPAYAWLACTGALCAAAARRPALLAPALVAAGLAVGTKTTTAMLATLALALVAARLGRARVAALARPLGLAAAAAAAVGGVWYARNLLLHGSPLWPLVSAPWGDPVPPFLERFHVSFLERPVETLDGRLDQYRVALGGGLVLLLGALAAPLAAPRRQVLAAAGVTVLAVLAWASAPYTGVARAPVFDLLAVSTTRYLVPATFVATLALGLAATATGRGHWVPLAFLAVAVAVNLREILMLPFPFLPGAGTAVVAAAAGTAAGVLAGSWGKAPALGGARAAALVVAGALALVPTTSGYMDRYALTPSTLTSEHLAKVVAWFAALPGYAEDDRPVAATPIQIGVLAGDRLRHPVELMPDNAGCEDVRRRVREGWVVVFDSPFAELNRHSARTVACLAGGPPPVFAAGPYRVYGPPR